MVILLGIWIFGSCIWGKTYFWVSEFLGLVYEVKIKPKIILICSYQGHIVLNVTINLIEHFNVSFNEPSIYKYKNKILKYNVCIMIHHVGCVWMCHT